MASALADIAGRGHRAVLVGGTGLYLRAAVDDWRSLAARADEVIELDTNVLRLVDLP